jgi:hypothetical protein
LDDSRTAPGDHNPNRTRNETAETQRGIAATKCDGETAKRRNRSDTPGEKSSQKAVISQISNTKHAEINLERAVETTEYTEHKELKRLATTEVLTHRVRGIIFVSDSFSVYSVYSVV